MTWNRIASTIAVFAVGFLTGAVTEHAAEGATTLALHRTGTQTLVIGDSLTYFGTDDLLEAHPQWTVDGIRGSELTTFDARYATYLETHRVPDRIVIALGTNEAGATLELYQQIVDEIPSTTRVVLVTTVCNPDQVVVPPKVNNCDQARADQLGVITEWMRAVAEPRPDTCLVPWRQRVRNHLDLLTDGVHQTNPVGRQIWADMVTANVTAATCGSPP